MGLSVLEEDLGVLEVALLALEEDLLGGLEMDLSPEEDRGVDGVDPSILDVDLGVDPSTLDEGVQEVGQSEDVEVDQVALFSGEIHSISLGIHMGAAANSWSSY